MSGKPGNLSHVLFVVFMSNPHYCAIQPLHTHNLVLRYVLVYIGLKGQRITAFFLTCLDYIESVERPLVLSVQCYQCTRPSLSTTSAGGRMMSC